MKHNEAKNDELNDVVIEVNKGTEHGECPNCGGVIHAFMDYLDDYDVTYRCSAAVSAGFKGDHSECYGDFKPPKAVNA